LRPSREEAAAVADVETRRDPHAAKAREAPGLHRDIGKPTGSQKPNAKPMRGSGEQAQTGSEGCRCRDARREYLQRADREREQAGPAHVGDRVDEAARAFGGTLAAATPVSA
jgi:hypothetical protein